MDFGHNAACIRNIHAHASYWCFEAAEAIGLHVAYIPGFSVPVTSFTVTGLHRPYYTYDPDLRERGAHELQN